MTRIIAGGLLYVINEIRVGTVIIGKQYENSENYNKFIKLVKEKEINIKLVEAGRRVDIEKDLYMDILWPCTDNIILENSINNNSLVCKLIHKNFSMLFTGDIEEVAEKYILNKYKKNIKVLKSDIIKIAHHGSKTSSTQEFLKAVDPKYAVIGVGKNNKFGHPSVLTIQNLKTIRTESYRTDQNGEITIKVNTKKIEIKTLKNQ